MTQDTRPVRATIVRMIERHRVLIPLYDQAVRDQNLQDLILVRHELAAIVEQADQAIADCITKHIKRRSAEG